MAKTKTSFKPGRKRVPGSGRKPGQQNRATLAAKEMALKYLADPKYEESLKERLLEGKAPHMETLLHQYAFGKPKETVAGDNDSPLKVLIEHVRRDLESSTNGSA